MTKVRLREVKNGQDEGTAPAIALPPLRIAGVVIRKPALVEALRIYMPGLADLQVTEDGEYFWLLVREEKGNEDQTPKQATGGQ